MKKTALCESVTNTSLRCSHLPSTPNLPLQVELVLAPSTACRPARHSHTAADTCLPVSFPEASPGLVHLCLQNGPEDQAGDSSIGQHA